MYKYIMYIVMSVSIHRTSLDRNTRGDRGIIISICGYVPIDSSVSTADITITIVLHRSAPRTSKIGRQKPYILYW